MKKISLLFVNGLIALLVIFGTANATPINITGYDIQNADISGNGGSWRHSYTGSIVNTGSSGGFGPVANYSGGTGTMADGLDGPSVQTTQLFNTSNNAVITLFLDNFYSVNSIELWQGDFSNAVPGGIEFIDVSIGGLTDTLSGTPFTTPGSTFSNRNDRYSLLGSSLSGIVTNQLTLSSISTGNCCNAFSISEIRLDGNVAPVPEPSTMVLLGTGLIGLVGFNYKRKKQTT